MRRAKGERPEKYKTVEKKVKISGAQHGVFEIRKEEKELGK